MAIELLNNFTDRGCPALHQTGSPQRVTSEDVFAGERPYRQTSDALRGCRDCPATGKTCPW